MKKKILRIIDVNINRLLEGLRVNEEICRFILEDKKLTKSLKSLRHKIPLIVKRFSSVHISSYRDSEHDVGSNINSLSEMNKNSIRDLVLANTSRVKESARVLEEFSKIIDVKSAEEFKLLRFKFYKMEVKLIEKLETIRHC